MHNVQVVYNLHYILPVHVVYRYTVHCTDSIHCTESAHLELLQVTEQPPVYELQEGGVSHLGGAAQVQHLEVGGRSRQPGDVPGDRGWRCQVLGTVLYCTVLCTVLYSRGRKGKNFPGSRFWWTKKFRMNNTRFYELTLNENTVN